MNSNIIAGKVYRIPHDFTFEDEVSPFRGLYVYVMYVGKIDDSGMLDCVVKLLCSESELAARISVISGQETSEKNVHDAFGEHLFSTDGYKYPRGLYVEHDTRYLEQVFPE